MQIRQVIALDDADKTANSLLLCLEQLGLQICNASNCAAQDLAGDALLICGPGFESTPQGSLIIRQAMNSGCCVLMDSSQFADVLEEIRKSGGISDDTRKVLASYALYRCMAEDARRLAALQGSLDLPRYMVTAYEKVQDLRYGENWHQHAALYRRPGALGLHSARKLCGREISYNNVVDAETVLDMLIDLSEYDGVGIDRPLAVIVKHANPCGVAYGQDLAQAYRGAFATDPKSAFGGVIGFNRPVDIKTAEAIGDSFVEVLLAPGYEPDALKMLMEKPNRRILDLGDMLSKKNELYGNMCIKGTFGGILVQDCDTGDILEWKVVTKRAPTDEETHALRFAWKIAKFIKSNALVYTTGDRTIGIGSGQVSRVDSARFGAEKAEEHGLSTVGTVAATDSFFPFRDGLDSTYRAGATAVVHPGGSIRDAEVIQAADEHGMAMVFTGMRHFRH